MKRHYASIASFAALLIFLIQPSNAQVFAPNTVTVVGLGTFGMKPDTVAISIHTAVVAEKMADARSDQEALARRIDAVLAKYKTTVSSSLIANARSVGRGQMGAGPREGNAAYEIVSLSSASSSDDNSIAELISDLINLDDRISISMVWGMKDPEPLKAEALKLATSDAERQKDLLAQSFGLKGGKLISVSTVTSGDMKSYSDTSELPIVGGKNSEGLVVVTTRVVATFALDPP